MNLLGPGLVDAVTLASALADIRSLVQDGDTATTVTVSTPTAGSFDPAAGTVTETTASDTVQGYLAPLTLREIGEVYRLGDRRLFLVPSDLSATPTPSSTVAIGSETWRAIAAEFDPLLALHRLVIRRAS